MKKQIVFVLAGAAVILALSPNMAKGDFDSFAICADSNEQNNPDVSENIVVWSDKRSGGYDIYSYDLAEPNEYPICTVGDVQTQPAISGDIIVWTDKRNGNYDIFGYDFSTATEFTICTNDADQQDPAISGNIAVWCDKRNYSGNSYDIYGCDISNISEPNEFPICTDSSGQYCPAIDGDIVIWIDVRDGNPNIYGYNLTTETEFPICTNSSGQYNPQISGDIVVWADDRNGNSDIYGIDITTLPGGSDFPICIDSAGQSLPAVSGDIVVWQDKRNGDNNYNIYGYNLATSSEFVVCTVSTDQKQPAVNANTIVWQDQRNGNADIYGAYMPVLSIITLLSPNGGEMMLAGSADIINWQSSGPTIDYVSIEYSMDSGQSWVPIDSNVPNTGSFDWDPIPIVDSNQCLVHISDKDDPDISDISDNVFTIFKCSPSLTADLSGDCYVDFDDFSLFAGQWLNCGNPYDPNWCANN